MIEPSALASKFIWGVVGSAACFLLTLAATDAAHKENAAAAIWMFCAHFVQQLIPVGGTGRLLRSLLAGPLPRLVRTGHRPFARSRGVIVKGLRMCVLFAIDLILDHFGPFAATC